MRTFGKLHILVNNAGIGDFGKRSHETDDATWMKVLDINLTGVFRMTRAAIPELIKSGGGAIINISTRGQPGRDSWPVGLYRVEGRAGCAHSGHSRRLCGGQHPLQCGESRSE